MLPNTLVDQIAAGEVVERPASVVKELVENALDAGAARIGVEVREGGSAWLAVSDDGSGMAPEDAQVALQRHATSKIAAAADLARIDTLGFRGEALPAIASVSRFRLRTRPHDAEHAFEIRVDAGTLLEARPVGGPPGTRIEVADLFAGVPARRKFLKKPGTEWGHVADWLSRAALAHPAVHFDLRRDDKPATAWPASDDLRDRIAAVLSDDVAAALVAVEADAGPIALRGYASRPDFHRPTAAGVYWYVNGRPVRDRLLRHALLEVYRDWLPRGRHPSAVLFLEVPSESVDVNVHPAKWEVRFADPQAVHRAIRHGVRAAVEERRWLAGSEPAGTGPAATPGFAEGHRSRPAGPPGSGGASPSAPTGDDWLFARRRPDVSLAAFGTERVAEGEGAPEATSPPVRFGDLRLVGALFDTYLVVEGKEVLLLVDQHAAHERVLYERLRAQRLGAGVERQALLITTPVELEAGARSALLEAQEAVAALGFEIEPFGEEAVAVRALPALLAGRDPVQLVRGLADECVAAAGVGGDAVGLRAVEALDRTLATMACHAARRAGDRLDPREQQALLDALDTIPWAPCCPHGRPVAIPLPQGEIERRFGRR